MINFNFRITILAVVLTCPGISNGENLNHTRKTGLPLFYWQAGSFTNFGDYLSLKLIERITERPVTTKFLPRQKKLLAIGSVLARASDGDVVWGSGVSGKRLKKSDYSFKKLDIRAVRGPLTRQFLIENFNLYSPEVYGDPALLIPYFFPEFIKAQAPSYDYIIIPHYTEEKLFPKNKYPNAVYPSEPWDQVIKKILDSKFVISSSLHGLIVAEAYHIPARMLKITENEPMFKYNDYYAGTGRPSFQFATSIEEALRLGGEPPFKCDLQKLYAAFPFDYWENTQINVALSNG